MADIFDEAAVDILDESAAVILDEAAASAPAGGVPELPYASVTRASDDTTLVNDVQAAIAGGSNVQEVTDAASIAKYLFARTYSRDDLILLADADALAWAQWVLFVSKTTETRFETLVLQPKRDPADLWPQVLGREIGDRIQVWRRPPGSVPVTRDCFVRGMQHDFDASAQTWQTQFTLQDANRYAGFLILDDAAHGQLDTAALAY